MEGTITIHVSGKCYAIPYDDIIYMEKDLRKIVVHTMKGEIAFYGKFCDVMPLLDERFTNCHRSYVLNMDEIRCLSDDVIVMSSEESFRFGLKCFQRLKRDYMKYLSTEPESEGAEK